MSEAGFNDDFLEKELFGGGDDDGLDSVSMDVDDMMHTTGQSIVSTGTYLVAASAAVNGIGNGKDVVEDDQSN
ncbi:hypothetical protein GGI21_000929, partial [Coemansia aciculifera]